MRIFVLLLLVTFLSGCFEAPLKHEHMIYNYEIKYGRDLDNLNQSLTYQCEAYYHGSFNYNFCYESLNQIDGYICAVDGRLYLKSTSKSYRSVSTAITPLDNMYCKISKVVINTSKYEYVDGLFKDTDTPLNKD